ncbi:angiopoietin-related protein 4-like isoform X2 [Drosophila sulfurigaster albostrigata]|uniref:angiopoietin-related protein 4-like isoform X2 n=1 Tax=Drosophila sulfurigaster albostrigata TaxID=89887 RepID=UPI002D21D9F7|nr:angiopoietin-related protein 4-like isoform X2 [Drosophila sulfurigaster albostrigata]
MQKYLKLLTVFLIVAPRWTGSIRLNEDTEKKIEENEKKIRQLEAQNLENEKYLNFEEAINSTRDYISSLENQLNQCREQSKNHTDILQLKINDNEIKLKVKDEIIAKQKTEIEQNVLLLKIQENDINKNNQQLEDYRDLIESLKSIIKPCENVISFLESGNNKTNQQNSKLDATCINSLNELQQENTKLNSQLQNISMEISYLENQLNGCKLNNTKFAKYNHDYQILLAQCQKSKEDMQKEIQNKKIIQNELNDCKNYSSHIENQLRVTQLNLTDLQEELTKIQKKPVTILPKSCLNLSPGIQEIQLPNNKSCNRRINGEQDFDKNWQEYVDGFGYLDGEFWFGLEKLHLVTSSMRHQLQISGNTFYGSHYENLYDYFRIGNSDSLYKLEVTSKLTTYDPLKSHVNQKFAAYDKYNIQNSYNNCAKNGNGGWWYTYYCGGNNLNAQYDGGMMWSYNPITTATMKIRPYSNEY